MNTKTATALQEEPASATPSLYHVPNAEGFYEQNELITVTLSGGNICHFYLAHVEAGFLGGYSFFSRQPRNLIKQLPSKAGVIFETRDAALTAVVSIALKWFADHPVVVERLKQWPGGKSAEAGQHAVLPAALPDGQPAGLPIPAAIVGAGALPNKLQAVRGHFAAIPVGAIERNPLNPRKDRSEASMVGLTESIRAEGELLQPIAVRDMGAGREGKPDAKRYQLIFGEGRWLAHQRLNWDMIDAKVYPGELSAGAALVKALIENLQREDMNAMDEAEGFAELSHQGYTPAQMAEQTGKDEATIRRALGLIKLPAQVQAMVRSKELSRRQARELVHWVSGSGTNQHGAKANFVARPEVCVALAKWAVRNRISSDELAAQAIPAAAVKELCEAKLLIQVPDDYAAAEWPAADPEFIQIGAAYLCWSAAAYKAYKKKIDDTRKAAAKQAEEKAAARVAKAAEHKTSVPLSDLAKSKVDHVVLEGPLAIYADHLPDDCTATSIAQGGAEVVVCVQPEKLKQIQTELADAVRGDALAKLPGLHERATTKLRKLKKVGAREMAFIVEVAFRHGGTGDAEFNPEAFKLQGIKPRKIRGQADEYGREHLANYDPAELARLFLQTYLLAADGECELEFLRWLLETPRLGLLSEDAKAQEDMLSQIAQHLWGNKPDATFPWDDAPAAAPKPAKKSKAKQKGRK